MADVFGAGACSYEVRDGSAHTVEADDELGIVVVGSSAKHCQTAWFVKSKGVDLIKERLPINTLTTCHQTTQL